ncbi:MAG: YCF48-related protein, partial [Bacteroidota bacterium]
PSSGVNQCMSLITIETELELGKVISSQWFPPLVLRDMHWFTPDEGLVLGSTETFGSPNHVYKTYNGGESWKEITLDQGSLPFFVKIPNITIKFNGDHGVLAGGTGHLLYSEDKGETWQTVQKGYPDVHDLSSSAGVTYAALYGNAVIKNDESGWSELTAPLNSQHQKAAFDKVSNLGADDLALKDVYGEIHYSQDGGSTWNSLFTSLEDRALDIQFIDEKLAALVFKDNALLYYPDAKDLQSMELIIDGTPLPASVFDLFEVGDVLFARVESFLFKRENGSWEQVFFNNYVIRSLMMDEKGNAIMRFQDNTYHYSNDTGETWQETAFSDDILNRIDFTISTINGYGWLNDTTHYALVHGSPDISERFETSLILSADKGKSWESADFAIFSEPNELGRIGHSVDDEGNLWVGSANGSIYQWTLKETITGNEDPVSSVFSVYPNPTTGQFKLFTTQEIESYQLMNLHGQIIERGAFIRNSEYRIPEEKPTGLYILQLLTSTGEKRVVKIAKR